MAVATITHKPDLTKEQVMDVFRRHFEGKYRVEPHSGVLRDFIVIKNSLVGVGVTLQQEEHATKLIYTGNTPRPWAGALVGASLGILALLTMPLYNGLTKEVREFIETSPEFHA